MHTGQSRGEARVTRLVYYKLTSKTGNLSLPKTVALTAIIKLELNGVLSQKPIGVCAPDSLIETNEEAMGGGVVLDPLKPLVLQCNVTACADCVLHWWRIGERPSDMKASYETSRITLTNKQSRTNSSIVRSIIQSPQTSNFAASKQLRILQCNINGLCSTATKIKLEEIMEIAEKQKIQIIDLQETKLNEKYNLKYKNYNILRKDRNKEGGGLAFLIKNLYYEDIDINIPNTSDLEAQGIKVYLSQNKTINIFNMYHPPNNKLIDDGTMAQFLTDNTIIVGDLNAKHQLWGCSTPNPRGKILSNLFDDNAFMCLNDGNPTHHSYSYNTAQALDISFSSPDIFHKCKWQMLKSIGSDHLPILIEISTKTKTSSIKEKFWNFKKANWNLYQQNTIEDFRKAPTKNKRSGTKLDIFQKHHY
ncbi:hypothetical protein LAZ67_2004930 [Cordylochernes scorpioides]|uniref:Endonuclease/exonuclease/phosphatase domain-containing protein n=1 Tax=Cordylochernes scorpioides TaxID=51811 RepID=A0ABY6K6W0_9ARAC|nr:hypothetical protein LAZ67_2004930 [Cordylochernes scorpioides]